MTTALARIGDTLTNLVAHLATGKSKAAADRVGFRTLDDAELEAMYRGDWVARKAVDIPVNDMLRPWRSWQASADQITLQFAPEFAKNPPIEPLRIIQLIQKNRHYKLAGQDKITLLRHCPSLQDKVAAIKDMLRELTQ